MRRRKSKGSRAELNDSISSKFAYFEPLETRALLTAAPVALTPGDATTPGPVIASTTATLTWTAVDGVNGYHVNVYDKTKASSIGVNFDATTTQYTVTLRPGDQFVWNVRDLIGTTEGPVSNYLNFQTPGWPAPTITGPGSSTSPGPVLTTLTPTLTWNAVSTTIPFTGYQINLYDQTSKKFQTFIASASATSYTLPAGALTAGDTYSWNLRLTDGTQTGPESLPYLYFQAPPSTVQTLPAPVAIGPGSSTSPGPVLTTLAPTFTWNAVSTTVSFTGYQITLYDQTTKLSQTFSAPASATSFTVPAGTLKAGDSYVWNLRLRNGDQTGPVSTPYLYFQAPPSTEHTLPAPVAIGPGSSTSPGPILTTLAPTFTWNAVSTTVSFTGYQITLYDQTSKQSQTFIAPASATSFTVPAGTLKAGDSYVWNLRLINGTQQGPVSTPYLYFQAPPAVSTVPLPAPTIVGPGSSTQPGPVLTTFTPTFTWNAVSTTAPFTGYQINLYDLTARRFRTFIVSASSTSYKLPTGILVAGHSYVWNLRLRNGDKTGPESQPYLYFQAPPATVLPAPTIIGPGSTKAPGTKLTTLTPVLKWNAVTSVPGLTGYQIALYNITTHRGFTYRVGASDTQFAISGDMLAAGDQYVWNVRVLANGQSGPPSTYLFFVA